MCISVKTVRMMYLVKTIRNNVFNEDGEEWYISIKTVRNGI